MYFDVNDGGTVDKVAYCWCMGLRKILREFYAGEKVVSISETGR